MRLLYLYPEEWTARRAREIHTLATCVALAQNGVEVTLLTAGGLRKLRSQLRDVAGDEEVPDLHLVALSRALGPIRSASIFSHHFRSWIKAQPRFDWVYLIHLKAAGMLAHTRAPFAYEAHEIFAQTPQKREARQIKLHELEKRVLIDATLRVATSAPLATALSTWFALPNDFTIVPNAGLPPLEQSVASSDGPFVYAGSIAEWKGLDVIIPASREAQVPLKIIGGTAQQWRALGKEVDTEGIEWQPRVPLSQLPQALAGARAGLVPTLPETPSGRYSCPMKLFDYARCGLPVISTALPALQSLEVGAWCTQVEQPTSAAWAETLQNFQPDAARAEDARNWSVDHTWSHRAEVLIGAIRRRR